MKKRRANLLLFLISLLFIVGCSDYQEDFTFTGTVEEKLDENGMLVMKEFGGNDEGRKDGNIYEIPVGDIKKYSVGQKLEITVLSNTDEDIWNLENMKFEIKKINN